MVIMEKQIRERYALLLPLILAFRQDPEEKEKQGEERETIKVLQRKAANDSYPLEKQAHLERGGGESGLPMTAQTFIMVRMDEISLEVQGYGNVKIVPPLQYVYGVSTRKNGVPTNYNLVVAPGSGGLGYAVPYQTNEFKEAA